MAHLPSLYQETLGSPPTQKLRPGAPRGLGWRPLHNPVGGAAVGARQSALAWGSYRRLCAWRSPGWLRRHSPLLDPNRRHSGGARYPGPPGSPSRNSEPLSVISSSGRPPSPVARTVALCLCPGARRERVPVPASAQVYGILLYFVLLLLILLFFLSSASPVATAAIVTGTAMLYALITHAGILRCLSAGQAL